MNNQILIGVLTSVVYFIFYLVALCGLLISYKIHNLDWLIKSTLLVYLLYFIQSIGVDISCYISYLSNPTEA